MIMRSQGCTIQQALTPEAAAVVKQAVGLAKRRGHAQVTPLHVAHTMLSGSSSGLFRAACLQAHSHPLQCRALELCFNVALQRLPTSTVVPMLGPISSPTQQPAIANALVAAFKRAQAHQRRGVIENNQQQQPILAVKIEVEQLIISILDDPSVSRVMREAGFSSPLVKSKVEQALSSMELPTLQNQPSSNEKMGANPNHDDDVKGVIDSLTDKRNTVVVGESAETLEGIVKQVMERVEKGEVPQNVKDIKFIKVSLSSFGNLSKEKVEERVRELKSLIKGYNNKGVILYLDDLNWVTEFRSRNNNNNNDNNVLKDQQQSRWRSYYCPIEQVIVEIGKLGSEYLDTRVKVWILGIATFETYMRCRSGEPSLESIWDLHAITIPASSLSLSLVHHSELHLEIPLRKKKIELKGSGGCKSETTSSSSVLPPWLQKYKEEKSKRDHSNDDDQEFLVAKDLTRWGSFCNSTTTHQPSKSFERSLSFSSISPSSTLSFSPYDNHCLKLYPTLQSYDPKNFWASEIQTNTHDTNKDHPQQWLAAIRISSNPSSSTPTPTSSSELIKEQMESQCVLAPRFNEYNTDNLKMICNALEQSAPSQKEIIFDIASTILHCRSGKTRRKGNSLIVKDNENRIKEDTCLFFEGGDLEAKEKIARELAKLVFGSEDKFVTIGISSFSSSRAGSLEDSRNKRLRDEQSCGYLERFVEAMSSNPHRVFFIEDLEQVDYSSQMGFKKAIEGGKGIKYSSGEEVSFCDAIIILSCERFSSKSRACSPSMKLIEDVPSQEGGTKPSNKSDDASLEVSTSSSISLDLNISISCGEEDEVDQNVVREESRDEIGLLAVVDRCFVFKIVNAE